MQFFVSWRVIIKRIKAIRFMMADKTVPKRKKALVVFGLIYLFLPVDLIPPVLFPFGFLDDLVLWIWILYTLKETLDTYWMGEKPVNYSKKYKDAIEQDDFIIWKPIFRYLCRIHSIYHILPVFCFHPFCPYTVDIPFVGGFAFL